MTMGDESTTSDSDRDAADPGFGNAEKMLGAWAAYEHPLASGLAANALSHSESSATRRRQLAFFSRAAFAWWAVGIGVAVIAAIVFLSVAVHGAAGGGCRGGPDKLDPMNTTYQSADGVHWTAIYPCVGGGKTAIPVPAADVPGEGG